MQKNNRAKCPAPNRLAQTSLLFSILGIFSWFYPPVQIILGSAAAVSGWISRRDRHFTGCGIIGFIIGIFCILLSFFMFFQYMLVYSIARDPANADLIRQIYRHAQSILNAAGVPAT